VVGSGNAPLMDGQLAMTRAFGDGRLKTTLSLFFLPFIFFPVSFGGG
jgi:hypothetical protein